MRANSRHPNDARNSHSPENSSTRNDCEPRDEVEEVGRTDAKSDTAITPDEATSRVTVLATMEEVETEMEGWLRQNRESPYTMTEVGDKFPGYESITLTRAWYRVRRRLKKHKGIEVSTLCG